MRHQFILAAVCGLAAGGSAIGAFIELETPVVVQGDSVVSVEFLSADAGDIYYLGATVPTSAGLEWTPAPDTGEPGLGLRLFGSADVMGERVDLGSFAAGTELYFGFHLTNAGPENGFLEDVMRSDTNADLVQFGWDPDASTNGRLRLGWESNRDPKESDWDYDDAAFDLIITPGGGPAAPAPGGAMLLGLGGALAAQRRR